LNLLRVENGEYQDKILESMTDIVLKKNMQLISTVNVQKFTEGGTFIFPGGKIGAKGIEHCFKPISKKEKYSYTIKDSILDEYDMFLDRDHVGKYSGKIEKLLEIIENSTGPIFIFTGYRDAGAIPIALALEQDGYTR